MALTAATFAEQAYNDQVGNVGKLRTVRGTITFTAGYDSATGVSVAHGPTGLHEIVAIIPEGVANTGAAASVAIADGDATVTLWNGTTLVATSDQSDTVLPVLILGH